MKKIILASVFLFLPFSVYSQALPKWPSNKPSSSVPYYTLKPSSVPLGGTASNSAVFSTANAANSSHFIPQSPVQRVTQPLTVGTSSTAVTGRFTWTTPQFRTGIKSFLKVGRLSPQGLVVSAVLGSALDAGIDWIIGDDGEIYDKEQYFDYVPLYLSGSDRTYPGWELSAFYNDPIAACQSSIATVLNRTAINFSTYLFQGQTRLGCTARHNVTGAIYETTTAYRYVQNSNTCPSGFILASGGCYAAVQPKPTPVSSDELDSFVDTMSPSDLDSDAFGELVGSGTLPDPLSFEIEEIQPATLVGSPTTRVETDFQTGQVRRTVSQPEYDFSFRNQSGNAEIQATTRVKDSVYVDDVLVSETVTEVEGDAVDGSKAPASSFEWLCGVDGKPDCFVSVDDTGFEELEPLEDSQDYIDDYVESVLQDLPNCVDGDCSQNNPWGFSMDIFMPDFSAFTVECINPDISLFGAQLDIDLCGVAADVKPLLNFLVYFFMVFQLRRLFLSIVNKE